VGCQVFFSPPQNDSGNNFNKNRDNKTVYCLLQHKILHGKNESINFLESNVMPKYIIVELRSYINMDM